MTLLTETAETAETTRAAGTAGTTETLPAAAGTERIRHRTRRDADRWSRWADPDEQPDARVA